MKVLFVALSLLLISFSALAKCAGAGVTVWPASATIRPNSIILLEFYALSQELVAGLTTTYSVYLKSGRDKIPLHISEVLKGQMELTQVVLRLEKQLSAGLTYELIVENIPKEHRTVGHWKNEKKAFVPYAWTVVGEVDLLPPLWKQKPAYEKKEYIGFGCGPAELVYFTSAIEGSSEMLVKAIVKSLATGKSTSYYLTVDNGRIAVGHGMCSGPFIFGEGKEYEVIFLLMDECGNKGCEELNAIRFPSPSPKDSSETTKQ